MVECLAHPIKGGTFQGRYIGEVKDFDLIHEVEVSLFRTRQSFPSENEALDATHIWCEQNEIEWQLPSLVGSTEDEKQDSDSGW